MIDEIITYDKMKAENDNYKLSVYTQQRDELANEIHNTSCFDKSFEGKVSELNRLETFINQHTNNTRK